MLKVKNVSISRGGALVLSEISIELAKGEILHLAGANGSGKSSLALAIAGDLPISQGEINLNVKFGFLMQNLEIDFAISVTEFIQLAKPKAELSALLKKLDLEDIAEKKITEISMGQLQRVEFAQVLLQDPELFILDEPFSAQDLEHVELIKVILRELKAAGKAILLISHIEIAGLADKTLHLNN